MLSILLKTALRNTRPVSNLTPRIGGYYMDLHYAPRLTRLPWYASTTAVFLGLALTGQLLLAQTAPSIARDYGYKIVDSYPQARDVFTQGFFVHNGLLYQSAGQYKESRLIIRSLANSTPIKKTHLEDQYFAEGISLLGDKLYQLTWRAKKGFIYDPDSLKKIGEFPLAGEGWGLTSNNKELILSDGSANIAFIDPENFAINRSITVSFNGSPVKYLNELEWVDGFIYANIWQSNWILIIDPADGNIVGKIFLRDLLPREFQDAKTGVLNGIAYDQENKRLFVTGKYWPRLYHIELIPQ